MRDDIIADSNDIKFACSQCGQRIVVEKSAAGLTVTCPVCEGSVTVPHGNSSEERALRAIREKLEAEHAAYPDADFDPEAGELFTASPEQSRLRHDLDAAEREAERYRALFKKAVDECERVKASATHAQAEVKSFQSDRQQLKADLSQVRQRALAAEARVTELTGAIAAATQENAALREQIDNDLAISHERISATETQLAMRERELATLHAENTAATQALADVQAELCAMTAEAAGLRTELATAQELLNDAAEAEQRLASAQRELAARWEEADAENRRLGEERGQLAAQVEALRCDLEQTGGGRELLSLRSQLHDLTADHARLTAALAEKAAAAESLAATEQGLREELQETLRLRAEAERIAAASSEAQMKNDNEILRGIIARQNADLGIHHAEVRRLRRARFAVRLVSTLFAIGLIGLGFFCLTVFTNRSLEEIFRQLVR